MQGYIENIKTSSNTLIDIYETLHPVTAEYTFKTTWEIANLDHILSHITLLNIFQKNQILQNVS